MISRIIPFPGEEFPKRLKNNKHPGEVIDHRSGIEICSSRWDTRSISLVGPRPTIGRVNPPLGIVEYDH